MSLSVLVTIEMFNAVNALSEDSSILTIGIFANPYLITAIMGSLLLHSVILYIPLFTIVFSTTALSLNDWLLVIGFSVPVIFIDEVLKFFARRYNE